MNTTEPTTFDPAILDPQQTIADLREQLARMQDQLIYANNLAAAYHNTIEEIYRAVTNDTEPNPDQAEIVHSIFDAHKVLRAERDAACALAGRLREALSALAARCRNHYMFTEKTRDMEEQQDRDTLILANDALALPAPDALAAQQAETARLRTALAELSAATIDSRCTCHDEPEGDTCEYCLRRRDAHEVADGLCFYKQP